MTVIFVAFCSPPAAISQQADEWEPYRKTGLFPGDPAKWIAPNMAKETVEDFTRKVMDGARGGEPKAMATLGRFFYIRGDAERAMEWLTKAAEAGHTGAQFDLGSLKAKGSGLDLAEAYQWLWLATWAKEPGADAALEELSARVQSWQMLLGVKKAAEFQEGHGK